MFAAAAPAIGAIASGAIGAIGSWLGGKEESKGQREANEMNLQIARENMAFQERMANTSWQRGVADMKAAGINPMLAVSKGGAVAPTGSTANMQNEGIGRSRGISQAASSAAGVMQTYMQLKQMEAETRRLSAEASVSENKVPKSEVNAMPYKVASSLIHGVAKKLGVVYRDPTELAVSAGGFGSVVPTHVNTAQSYHQSVVNSPKNKEAERELFSYIERLVGNVKGFVDPIVSSHRSKSNLSRYQIFK